MKAKKTGKILVIACICAFGRRVAALQLAGLGLADLVPTGERDQRDEDVVGDRGGEAADWARVAP